MNRDHPMPQSLEPGSRSPNRRPPEMRSLAAGNAAPCFRARRLGHVNLYISEYERSLDFYRRVVGLHDGWTRPEIGGGFLNNGASHHDIGFLPWNSPERRLVVNGPGLNHLAFDVGTERDLIDGYQRARALSLSFLACADHVIAKSLYTQDPNGIQLEIFVDTPIHFSDPDFLALRRATVAWDPLAVANPDATPYYVSSHTPRPSSNTVFPASRLDGVTIAVLDLSATVDFFCTVLGMRVGARNDEAGFALLQGTLGCRDLVAFEARDDLAAGLHHFSFVAFGEAELNTAIARSPSVGVELTQTVDHPTQRGAFLRDPDGNCVKLFIDRGRGVAEHASSLGREQALSLL